MNNWSTTVEFQNGEVRKLDAQSFEAVLKWRNDEVESYFQLVWTSSNDWMELTKSIASRDCSFLEPWSAVPLYPDEALAHIRQQLPEQRDDCRLIEDVLLLMEEGVLPFCSEVYNQVRATTAVGLGSCELPHLHNEDSARALNLSRLRTFRNAMLYEPAAHITDQKSDSLPNSRSIAPRHRRHFFPLLNRIAVAFPKKVAVIKACVDSILKADTKSIAASVEDLSSLIVELEHGKKSPANRAGVAECQPADTKLQSKMKLDGFVIGEMLKLFSEFSQNLSQDIIAAATKNKPNNVIVALEIGEVRELMVWCHENRVSDQERRSISSSDMAFRNKRITAPESLAQWRELRHLLTTALFAQGATAEQCSKILNCLVGKYYSSKNLKVFTNGWLDSLGYEKLPNGQPGSKPLNDGAVQRVLNRLLQAKEVKIDRTNLGKKKGGS